jgi:hypothetical protein
MVLAKVTLKTTLLAVTIVYTGLAGLMLNGSLRTCCQTSFNIALAILALGPIIAVIAFVGWAARGKLFAGRG